MWRGKEVDRVGKLKLGPAGYRAFSLLFTPVCQVLYQAVETGRNWDTVISARMSIGCYGTTRIVFIALRLNLRLIKIFLIW